jgi:hypothetical protein
VEYVRATETTERLTADAVLFLLGSAALMEIACRNDDVPA